MDELIIEVDKNNKQIGLRSKSEFYTNKYIHRAAHLILMNSKKEVLLQQRTSDKRWYPNLFTFSVSGTVGDESYDDCLKREMLEEIGLDITVKKLFIYNHFNDIDKTFNAVYFGRSDKQVKIETREIQNIVWMEVDKLKLDIINNSEIYTPSVVKGFGVFFKDYYDNI